MQVQEDVAALGVGAVDQRVDQQLSDDRLLVGGHARPQQAVGQLVGLAEVGDALPHRVDQLDRREGVVVPDVLGDLDAPLVVLEGLDHGRRAQPRPVGGGAQQQHAEVGQHLTAGEAVVVQQLVVGFLAHRGLDAVGRANRGAQGRAFGGVAAPAGDGEGGHRLPRDRGALGDQPQDVVAHDGPAVVADAQEIATVAGGRDADRPRNGEHDVLATVGARVHLGRQIHVDGKLADPLTDAVEQVRRHALAGGRLRRVVLDADQELPARAVGEAHAVLRQLGEVGGLARDRPQRLAVEVLALAVCALVRPVSHRPSGTSCRGAAPRSRRGVRRPGA